MTREEASNILDDYDVNFEGHTAEEIAKAFDVAFRALEQEPKTGHWITWKEAGNEISSETRFECSVCHDAAQTLCNGLDLLSSFCPNCGCRMVEPQERSDKS